MTKFEPKMMIMMGDIGSKRLEFSIVLSQKTFLELIRETNRIFSFAVRTWDPETGDAVIELVPGNGMALIAPGVDWAMTDQSHENLEIGYDHARARRKFYKDLLHTITRSMDEMPVRESVVDEPTDSDPAKDASPALPPEGSELG